MKNLQLSHAYSGNPIRAVEFVAAMLSAAGYRIDSRTDSSLRAVKPFGSYSFRNPISGIRAVDLQTGDGKLTANAELTTVPNTVWIGLCLVLLTDCLAPFVLKITNLAPALDFSQLGWALAIYGTIGYFLLNKVLPKISSSKLDTLLKGGVIMAGESTMQGGHRPPSY